MKKWLKYGLIGAVVGLFSFLLNYLDTIITGGEYAEGVPSIIGALFIIIVFMLLGALVGIILEKVKDKILSGILVGLILVIFFGVMMDFIFSVILIAISLLISLFELILKGILNLNRFYESSNMEDLFAWRLDSVDWVTTLFTITFAGLLGAFIGWFRSKKKK